MHAHATIDLRAFEEAITNLGQETASNLENQLRASVKFYNQLLFIEPDDFDEAIAQNYQHPERFSYINSESGEVHTFDDKQQDSLQAVIDSLTPPAELVILPHFNWDEPNWWDKYSPDSPLSVCAWLASTLANEDGEANGYKAFSSFLEKTQRQSYIQNEQLVQEWIKYASKLHPGINVEDEYQTSISEFETFLIHEWMDMLKQRQAEIGFHTPNGWYPIKGKYQVVFR